MNLNSINLNNIKNSINNLYGQEQVLGKGNASNMQSTTENGMFQHSIPYNNSEFFAYAPRVVSSKDIAQCSYFKLQDQHMDYQCHLNSTKPYDKVDASGNILDKYKNINLNTVLDLSGNVVKDINGNAIVLDNSYCSVRAMCQNKVFADKIIEMDKNHNINAGQYLDSQTNINAETMNIINMSMGILIMFGMIFSYSGVVKVK